MPYSFEEGHSDCPEGQGALILDETGEKMGCHADEESARQQIAAIEANKSPDPMNAPHMVAPQGSSLKDLDDKGGFGGYLVRFGGPNEHDLERDFFTKETNFWLKDGEGESATLFAHGTDPNLGKNRIDKGWASLTKKDGGVWMETQLQKRNEYEEAIHELAEKGKLGLSSGTASHLVEREPTKEGPEGVTHVSQWPLGLDGSATPTPAEPRTGIAPLKNISLPTVKEAVALGGEEGAFGMKSAPDNVRRVIRELAELNEFVKAALETKATEEEIEQRYRKFRGMVNMSASEIESWGETQCSNKASDNPNQVRKRVVGLLRTNKDDWGQKEYEQAGRVISFISRMKGVDGGEKPSEDCPTKRNISLRNWGFDPTKSMGYFNLKAEGEYSQGDLVAWEGGDAQGVVRRMVGPNDSVSPSTTGREFSGNEDEMGYLIELVDYDEEEDEVVGREETVFHLEGALSGISKSDVKGVIDELKSINEKFFGSRNGPDF